MPNSHQRLVWISSAYVGMCAIFVAALTILFVGRPNIARVLSVNGLVIIMLAGAAAYMAQRYIIYNIIRTGKGRLPSIRRDLGGLGWLFVIATPLFLFYLASRYLDGKPVDQKHFLILLAIVVALTLFIYCVLVLIRTFLDVVIVAVTQVRESIKKTSSIKSDEDADLECFEGRNLSTVGPSPPAVEVEDDAPAPITQRSFGAHIETLVTMTLGGIAAAVCFVWLEPMFQLGFSSSDTWTTAVALVVVPPAAYGFAWYMNSRSHQQQDK